MKKEIWNAFLLGLILCIGVVIAWVIEFKIDETAHIAYGTTMIVVTITGAFGIGFLGWIFAQSKTAERFFAHLL